MTVDLITPAGEFSLIEAALFGFGHRHETTFDGVLRMAFVTDDHRGQVGVEVRSTDGGRIAVRTVGGDSAVDQVARILSLDHDERPFAAICRRDPVLARLRGAAPGLRPVLFHSPYEAAVWGILHTRRPAAQAVAIRERLAQQHGRIFTLAGQPVAALPTPAQLLAVTALPGVPAPKLGWLHAIARAALAGELDAGKIAAMDPADATAALCRLPGIGPFYSALIHVRASGAVDVLPANEPRLNAMIERLYPGRDLSELAQAWRPYRTWAGVLIRAVAPRLHADLPYLSPSMR